MWPAVPRSCSSRCRMPSSRSWAVLRCEASTREDSSCRLLENFSICSMMPFRDLRGAQVTKARGPQHCRARWAGPGWRAYRVWEVALVTASISRSFSSFSRCSCSSWSLRISRMEALGDSGEGGAVNTEGSSSWQGRASGWSMLRGPLLPISGHCLTFPGSSALSVLVPQCHIHSLGADSLFFSKGHSTGVPTTLSCLANLSRVKRPALPPSANSLTCFF